MPFDGAWFDAQHQRAHSRFGDTRLVQEFTFAAIQNALNDLGTDPEGGEIFLPPGTYTGSTGLSFPAAKRGIALTGLGARKGSVRLDWTGGASGTMITLTGNQWCRLSNLYLEGSSGQPTNGISLQARAAPLSGLFEIVLDNVMIDGPATGILIGATDNLQASEVSLRDVDVYNATTRGLDIEGQNTLMIRGYGMKFESCARGVFISGGNLTAYSTLFLDNTVVDIDLDGSQQREVQFLGVDSEGSVKHLDIASNGNNFGFYEEGADIYPSVDGATIITDSSLFFSSWKRCGFHTNAVVAIDGMNPKPANSSFGVKTIEDCRFGDANGEDQNSVIKTGRINLGSSGNVYVRWKGLPLGLNTDPFKTSTDANYLTPFTDEGTAPTASTAYIVQGSDVYLTATGGTAVSITIKDAQGNTIESGLTTLTNKRIALGQTVDFGAFSAAPTVTAWWS